VNIVFSSSSVFPSCGFFLDGMSGRGLPFLPTTVGDRSDKGLPKGPR